MTRAAAVRLGVLAAAFGVHVALITLWVALVSYGFGGETFVNREFLTAPLILLACAGGVLGTIAYRRDSFAALAVVELAAAAAGSAGVVQLTSGDWAAPFILMFAVSPALFLAGGVCAAFALLKRAVATSSRAARSAG
jgi:hypothetical protein